MTQETTARLFEFMTLGLAGGSLIALAAAGLYDLGAIARRPRVAGSEKKLQKKSVQPPVTVIVYTDNDAGAVASCLDSIRRSLYGNYDIVIVDNASRDGTRRAVLRFLRQHPKFTPRFYAKRKCGSLQEVLFQAYQKSRKGDFAVILGASARPSPSFLKSAVARLSARPDSGGVVMNERVTSPLSIESLIPEVASAAKHVCMKCLSLLGARRGRVGLNGLYRRSLMTKGAAARVSYDGGLQIKLEHRGRPDIIAMQQLLGAATAFIVLVLMSYAMVMAATLVSYMPLITAWSLVAVGSLAAIWSDEGLSLIKKFQLTLSATLLYFLLYVALLKFLAGMMIRRIARIPKLKSVWPALAWPLLRRAVR